MTTLSCSVCGLLVNDIQLTGGALRAYRMRWATGHAKRCDGTVTIAAPPVQDERGASPRAEMLERCAWQKISRDRTCTDRLNRLR